MSSGSGTNVSNNVTGISIVCTPTPPRFAYVVNGDGTNYSVLVCSFATDGVTMSACQNTNLDAATYPSFSYPQGITFNNDGSRAYVTTYTSSALGPVAWECVVNSSDGTFSSCSSYVITSPSSYFQAYGMVALNNTNTTAYIVDYYGADVLLCPLNNSGAFSSSVCTSSGVTSLSNPIGIALDSAGTTAYIGGSGSGVSVCTVSVGAFTTCINKTGDGTISFNNVYDVALNRAGTLIYITEPYSNNVYACSTSPNFSSTFSSCFNVSGSNSFNTPYGIVLNRAGTMAYLTSNADPGNTYECPVKNDGTFDSCVSYNPGSVFKYATAITLVY